ncbi:ABC transporter permease subunit [Lactobacillus crispatus]|uniref:ABC transporter permease subunit n=1 Tax=Lactobacillus crispatus TaxID=47770 RepID=A0A6A1Z5R7_9LACO|nr:ABC transporter permease subunit [Lactobacillus crispatus]KAB1972999.1 ABC transporter permease subunit [Lactobacillus crispatus]MCT3537925.1 tellurium resistance protein TerC [Lactobacillus crispatus]
MKKQYFLFQLKIFLTNPKNVGLFFITIVLSLYFGLVSAPQHLVIENVDPYAISKEYQDDQAFLKVAEKEFARANKGNSSFNPSEGAKDAVTTYPTVIKYDHERLKALKGNNWHLYTKYSSMWYKKMDDLIWVKENQNYMYPLEYYHNNNYKEDGHFGYQRTFHFYDGLLKSKAKLNKNVLEERTTLQRLQQSLSGWTMIILIIIIILFTADMVTNDQKYRTVVKNIPLSKRTILWLKTAVIEIGVLFNFLVAFAIVILCTAPKYGFGSLNLLTPIYTGRLYFKTPFVYQTLGQYCLEFLFFAVVLTFIFIRLTLLLSLIFRNEYVAVIVASIFAMSAKVLYFSLGMGFVYPFLKHLPMTYFTIGESLTSNLSYLMDSPGWGFNDGIIPLVTLAIVIELTIWLFCQFRKVVLVK